MGSSIKDLGNINRISGDINFNWHSFRCAFCATANYATFSIIYYRLYINRNWRDNNDNYEMKEKFAKISTTTNPAS